MQYSVNHVEHKLKRVSTIKECVDYSLITEYYSSDLLQRLKLGK
jgi:hypothetical protein